MKKTLLGLTIMAVLFSSCKKDDEIETVALTKSNAAGSYILTKVETKVGTQRSDNTNAWFEFVGSCSKDDLTVFNANGNYAINDVGTVCDPSRDYSGTWDVANSTTLTIDGVSWPVELFTAKELKLVREEPAINGQYIFTYTRQ
jgi:hypothetical protein